MAQFGPLVTVSIAFIRRSTVTIIPRLVDAFTPDYGDQVRLLVGPPQGGSLELIRIARDAASEISLVGLGHLAPRVILVNLLAPILGFSGPIVVVSRIVPSRAIAPSALPTTPASGGIAIGFVSLSDLAESCSSDIVVGRSTAHERPSVKMAHGDPTAVSDALRDSRGRPPLDGKRGRIVPRVGRVRIALCIPPVLVGPPLQIAPRPAIDGGGASTGPPGGEGVSEEFGPETTMFHVLLELFGLLSALLPLTTAPEEEEESEEEEGTEDDEKDLPPGELHSAVFRGLLRVRIDRGDRDRRRIVRDCDHLCQTSPKSGCDARVVATIDCSAFSRAENLRTRRTTQATVGAGTRARATRGITRPARTGRLVKVFRLRARAHAALARGEDRVGFGAGEALVEACARAGRTVRMAGRALARVAKRVGRTVGDARSGGSELVVLAGKAEGRRADASVAAGGAGYSR